MNASLGRTCEGQNFAERAMLCLAPTAEVRVSISLCVRNGTLSNHGHPSDYRAASGREKADYALVAI